MSVNVSDRNSTLEVLNAASRLYNECESLTLREFGIRSKTNPLRAKYQYLLGRESDPSVIDDIIREKSLTILRTAEDIVTLIDGANAIYPRFKVEFETRLELQNSAIAKCSMLNTELSNVVHLLNIDISVFKVVTDKLQNVNHLLIEWRKSDRKKYRNCL